MLNIFQILEKIKIKQQTESILRWNYVQLLQELKQFIKSYKYVFIYK